MMKRRDFIKLPLAAEVAAMFPAWAVAEVAAPVVAPAVPTKMLYLWLIRNSSTGTVDQLLSNWPNPGTLVMPEGFDQKRLIGRFFTEGDGIV